MLATNRVDFVTLWGKLAAQHNKTINHDTWRRRGEIVSHTFEFDGIVVFYLGRFTGPMSKQGHRFNCFWNGRRMILCKPASFPNRIIASDEAIFEARLMGLFDE